MLNTKGATSILVGPYFPKADPPFRLSAGDRPLPERPTNIGPIFDEKRTKEPIQGFEQDIFEAIYAGPDPSTGVAVVPPQPESSTDKYLYPLLARNERLRLTMLWYYTRRIAEDEELLLRLQTMLNMVQKLMGWEFAIVGILDEAVYTRLATANLPIALLPRRESTCSHTINQELGKVFMVTNMAEDWRFRHSPHVEVGGLRSYAGTQLRVKTDDGGDVALGSLCVASNDVQRPLTEEQKLFLVRFAEMLTTEIIERTRRTRMRDRQSMTDLLSGLQSKAEAADDVEQVIKDTVRQLYPDSEISIQDATEDVIELEGHVPIKFDDVKGGLWEDVEFIESAIKLGNHQRLYSPSTVRAVIRKCGRLHKVVVVASRDVQLVFDDLDAWFVEQCANIVGDVQQSRSLREALKAKEVFLRGITHQLRTPIHGVLGSVELLTEQLASHRSLDAVDGRGGPDRTSSLYLATIRNSGRELMSTVNNILKLNSWAEGNAIATEDSVYDLQQLEEDVMSNILQMVTEDELVDVAIGFENQLSSRRCIVTVDETLLKECLQSLVLNSIQATQHGTVSITVSMNDDDSVLRFDVADTGCGVNSADYQRIFEPYEKAAVHKPGAGLGLTLADKIAKVLRGSVTLVSSKEGKGSHFRAEFVHPILACSVIPRKPAQVKPQYMPSCFYVVETGSTSSHMLRHLTRYLEQRELVQSHQAEGSLLVVDADTSETGLLGLLNGLSCHHLALCLRPTKHHVRQKPWAVQGHQIMPLTGPLCTQRLDEILRQADQIYQDCNLHRTEPVNNDCATVAAEPKLPDGPQAPTLKALLVDDNAINLRILRMYSEKRNIPYISATDGNEAVQAYQDAYASGQPITLTLMDLQMPNCSGIRACTEIRAFEAKEGILPSVIFIVTGQDSPADKRESFEAGANDFVVKPMGLKSLDRRVQSYFKGFGD